MVVALQFAVDGSPTLSKLAIQRQELISVSSIGVCTFDSAAAKPHQSFANGVAETCCVCSFWIICCSPEPPQPETVSF